jgi:hypothetical protein
MSDFYLMPMEQLISPSEGSVVFLERWWVVTEDNDVLFYTKGGVFSPQCNRDKSIAEHGTTLYPNSRVHLVKVAYVPAKAVYNR